MNSVMVLLADRFLSLVLDIIFFMCRTIFFEKHFEIATGIIAPEKVERKRPHLRQFADLFGQYDLTLPQKWPSCATY